MILGRGSAKTDKAVIAEYFQFLREHEQQENPEIYKRLFGAPEVMLNRIGKPILQWGDDELLKLYVNRTKSTGYTYSCFLAFLFFRGYRHGTIYLLSRLPIVLTRCFRKALLPYRQRIGKTCKDLHYYQASGGSELNLLIWLLVVAGKPLDELTRPEFDLFRSKYQKWYQQSQKRAGNRPNARLFRLERYLVHWNIIPAAKIVFRHEEHFALLRHEPIRQAILVHMKWCDGKYTPSSIHSRRATLIHFFLWFQENYPDCDRLDQVTRLVALEYGRYLKDLVDQHKYALKYRNDLYRGMRLFFDFVIDEQLNTSPDRNPFGKKDIPNDPDPVPRYIADQELRLVLDYCNNGASLKEKTVVITLLHTGLRAAELAALSKSDIIEIQGKWKIHVNKGKGLKDRVIPLTQPCLEILQTWQESGWEKINDHLFTRFGRVWQGGTHVCTIVREIGLQLKIQGLTPHRFRHTFAVSLLNYGMRESALQKLMGHATLNMTLEYARILDHTVEEAFNTATTAMQVGPLSWVPSFFSQQDYSIFNEVDAVNWIRLPHGYCRRNPQLHCESDVKCLLCERFRPSAVDRFRLQEMYQQYLKLEMPLKANIVLSQIRLLENQVNDETQGCFLDRCGTAIPDFGKTDGKSAISIAQPLGV